MSGQKEAKKRATEARSYAVKAGVDATQAIQDIAKLRQDLMNESYRRKKNALLVSGFLFVISMIILFADNIMGMLVGTKFLSISYSQGIGLMQWFGALVCWGLMWIAWLR